MTIELFLNRKILRFGQGVLDQNTTLFITLYVTETKQFQNVLYIAIFSVNITTILSQ